MWFIFFPWFSFQCAYPESDVSYPQFFTYIESQLETFKPWTWSSFSRITNKPYIGRLDPHSITLSRSALRKKFINPIAQAKIRSRQGITHIHVNIRPHGLVIAWLLIFFLFFAMFFVTGAIAVLSHLSWEELKMFVSGLRGIGMGITFIYLLHQLWFTIEVRNIESLFNGAADSIQSNSLPVRFRRK